MAEYTGAIGEDAETRRAQEEFQRKNALPSRGKPPPVPKAKEPPPETLQDQLLKSQFLRRQQMDTK